MFTPKFEIDLCGHATLAASFVVFNELEPALQEVVFSTISGTLTALRSRHLYEMSFPSRPAEKIHLTAEQLSERRGTLRCVLAGARVQISGEAVLYLRGELCL